MRAKQDSLFHTRENQQLEARAPRQSLSRVYPGRPRAAHVDAAAVQPPCPRSQRHRGQHRAGPAVAQDQRLLCASVIREFSDL